MPLFTALGDVPPDTPRGLMWMAMKDTMDVLRYTAQSDSGGGVTNTWGTAGTALPCRIDPLVSVAGVRAGRIDERSTHLVTTMSTADVTTRDRLRISGRGTYEVTQAVERTGRPTATFEVLRLE